MSCFKKLRFAFLRKKFPWFPKCNTTRPQIHVSHTQVCYNADGNLNLFISIFQLLILCFVRKLMDYTFTQGEMYWLDHILPDEHRRKKEDEAKEEGGIIPEEAKLKPKVLYHA